MKDTSAAIMAQYLEQENVKYIFGVPGAHVLPIYDAIGRTTSIKPVLTKHEAGGAFLAYGYAAISGNMGVCCGTVGPGATNMVSGITAAHMDSIPLLVITGQVGIKAFGRSAHQEATGYGRSFDQSQLFRDITKMSVMITDKGNMSRTLRSAIRTAVSGRPGPVMSGMEKRSRSRPIRRWSRSSASSRRERYSSRAASDGKAVPYTRVSVSLSSSPRQ